MHGFTISLTLISAFTPVPPPTADQSAATPEPVVTQAAPVVPSEQPQPVTPPPQPQPMTPPPQTAVATTPGYVPPLTGAAPPLRGASVWGILPYDYGEAGVGIGARFMIPLGFQPLLKNTNVRDGFALEFGADYLRWSIGLGGFGGNNYALNEFVPTVGLMWNVWLNDRLVLYPKFELGYRVIWWSGLPSAYDPGYGWLAWNLAAGIMYKLDSGLTIRGELGNAGLKGGVGWLF